MEDIRTLDRLAVGQKATVAALSAPEDQRRRMLDLGFVPGSAVTALQESAARMRGTSLCSSQAT